MIRLGSTCSFNADFGRNCACFTTFCLVFFSSFSLDNTSVTITYAAVIAHIIACSVV